MFLGLLNPNPFVRLRGRDPDPPIKQKKSKKNLDYYCFVTSLWLYLWKMMQMYLQKVISRKGFCWLLKGRRSMTKIAWSGARSRYNSQKHGSRLDPYSATLLIIQKTFGAQSSLLGCEFEDIFWQDAGVWEEREPSWWEHGGPRLCARSSGCSHQRRSRLAYVR